MKFLVTRFAMMLAVLFAAALPLCAPAQAADDPAVATVQTFYDALLGSMKAGKAAGPQGRYTKMRPAVEAAFDTDTMIKYAVGADWDKTSPADQKALTEAFTRMTAAQYAGNFDSFTSEKFVVDPKVTTRGTDRYVSSQLITPSQRVTFIYRLRQFGGSWKIIDVLLDGSISQLTVYRSDFAATYKSSGAAGLVKKIDELSDKALKG